MAEMGRLALRVEGNWWVAYYARPDTMDEALELGRVKMGVVARHSGRREMFLDLMRSYVEDLLADITGARVEWKKRVPEHERSGNA